MASIPTSQDDQQALPRLGHLLCDLQHQNCMNASPACWTVPLTAIHHLMITNEDNILKTPFKDLTNDGRQQCFKD